ncbi:MAG: ubiquitin-like small modifier protein 1 [Chloroflexota bacterium]
MQVRFYANMRAIVGQETFNVDILDEGTTLRALFARLAERFPQLHSHLFDAQDNLRQDVPIFVNGRNPRLDGAMDASLRPGDVISLFSPISSGKMNVEVLRD